MGLRGPAVNLKQAPIAGNHLVKHLEPTEEKFMLQRRVIKLYRDLFRATNGIADEQSKKELRDWIRTDFKKHKPETDEYAIKMLILHGERALKELQTNISLSK